MKKKLAQKTRRQQNEALQRKTARGRFNVEHPTSLFSAPRVPGAPLRKFYTDTDIEVQHKGETTWTKVATIQPIDPARLHKHIEA